MVYCKLYRISPYFTCDGRTSRILVPIYWYYANCWNKLCILSETLSQKIIDFNWCWINYSPLLIIIQLIFSFISNDLSYTELIKELTKTGVHYKWQMLITCHTMP